VCTGNVCQAPSCTDGVQNGAETDLDCGGGGLCGACSDGKVCAANGDCTSQVCTGNVCQAPSCTDGVQNGAETDLDCGGGGLCGACSDGQGCSVDTDCASQLCRPDVVNGGVRCAASATLTLSATGPGTLTTVESPQLSCTDGTVQGVYPLGSQVTVQASPLASGVVTVWSEPSCSGASCTLTLSTSLAVSVTFSAP
jgi:hypothetical protein